MTEREIDIILNDFAALRDDLRALRSRVDRLYWSAIVVAVSIGGPQVVRELVAFFGA